MRQLVSANAPAATVLVRLLVGSVPLSEGIQKFLYPAELAAGRFAKIGIPGPVIMGPFVGGCAVCGALLIIGLLARLAAIVLLIDISVAILSTKIPVDCTLSWAHLASLDGLPARLRLCARLRLSGVCAYGSRKSPARFRASRLRPPDSSNTQ